MRVRISLAFRVLSLLLLIFLSGCTKNKSDDQGNVDNASSDVQSEASQDFAQPKFTDEKVAEVLNRAFITAGGLDEYRNMKTISYTKRSVLFLEDGSTESELTQQHNYILQPELSGEITWKSDGDSYRTFYSSKETYKEKNGVRIPDSEESARKSFFSATYVLFIPFKLIDPGALLTYAGRDTLDSGKIADVIRAEYDAAKHKNHSTSEVWWYYFDVNDGSHLSSLVYHPPTYAYIENDVITDDYPMRFNIYRKTFRTDAQRKKEYLRGEFYYSNYTVNQ
jgi:hypothetical protein